jgi:hypothetical protein
MVMMMKQQETLFRSPDQTEPVSRRSWVIAFTSLVFILLQSACTAVMAISGVRVVIGLGALAAAAGLHRPAEGFHADAIRIPMMVLAVGEAWRSRADHPRHCDVASGCSGVCDSPDHAWHLNPTPQS